jgi:hypothetical protein
MDGFSPSHEHARLGTFIADFPPCNEVIRIPGTENRSLSSIGHLGAGIHSMPLDDIFLTILHRIV